MWQNISDWWMLAGLWASLVAQIVKNLPAMQETQVWSLGQEDPLEKGIATHSSILAWRIPGTEEPGGLRAGHDWASNTHTHTHTQRQAGVQVFIIIQFFQFFKKFAIKKKPLQWWETELFSFFQKASSKIVFVFKYKYCSPSIRLWVWYLPFPLI